MKIRFAAAAQNSIIDANNNRLSVINIVESVVAASVPFMIPSLSVAYIIEKEGTDALRQDANLTVEINGAQIVDIPQTIHFSKEANMTRVMNEIQGFVFPAYGKMIIKLTQQTKIINTIEIDIERASIATSAANNPSSVTTPALPAPKQLAQDSGRHSKHVDYSPAKPSRPRKPKDKSR